ncbi:hypothetical protein M3148_05725 [Georgenia satyanarayanai]|nr:hypothetical protein [Georgenia satyanarayanai]MCM3660496.1 hypothetical protein [Georgenia satyanarayanai]
MISREIRRDSNKTRGYKVVTADCRAQRRRSRSQTGKIGADPVLCTRVLADLKHSRTPRPIAGRLHPEARDDSVSPMKGSMPADGKTVSHNAIYRFIYALPKGELAAHGVTLRYKRTRRRAPRPLGQPDAAHPDRWASAGRQSWAWSAWMTARTSPRDAYLATAKATG